MKFELPEEGEPTVVSIGKLHFHSNEWLHHIQQNDTQHNDIKHIDNQHKEPISDTQHVPISDTEHKGPISDIQ